MKRAALLIGIDRAKGLPTLRAAVAGAKSMDSWLKQDGYETFLCTDEEAAVTVADLKAVVKKIAESNQYEKLVVYFAGHGIMNGSTEIWWLSNANQDEDEVVDVGRCAENSRSGTITSVIFISDACRTIPQTLAQTRMRGQTLFPTANNNLLVEVDRFFATRPGDAALEIARTSDDQSSAAQEYVGVFTDVLKNTHFNPPIAWVGPARVEGAPSQVVLSRRLRQVLPELVNEEVQNIRLSLRQEPQLRLESGDDGYLARPIITKGLRPTVPRFGQADRNLHLEYATRFDPRGFDFRPAGGRVDANSELTRFAKFTRIFEGMEARVQYTEVAGATVIGREVGSIWQSKFARISYQAGETTIISTDGRRPTSVTVRFQDGTGAVLALLPGYHLFVWVDETGISHMRYLSTNLVLYGSNDSAEGNAADLRIRTAAAINVGLYPTDRPQVREVADEIRLRKKTDPTLGLYAAMGYAEVGLKREIASVLEFMAKDIKGHLLDLLIFSGGRRSASVAPFCPMLSQTWAHLDSNRINCPEIILEAGRHRQQSTWTTFTPTGMKLLNKAVGEGVLNWVNQSF